MFSNANRPAAGQAAAGHDSAPVPGCWQPGVSANFAFAQREHFILKEERTFPQPAPASYLQAPTGFIEAA
jgi:hypothetical protein